MGISTYNTNGNVMLFDKISDTPSFFRIPTPVVVIFALKTLVGFYGVCLITIEPT
tara:strand:+ start:305 stop:469 length:165 start_codon:yes stop_codon:yes gene_type:complete